MMDHINCLPQEILFRIFSYYLESETQLDFIRNVARVCRRWKEISTDGSFWRTFDGTLPFLYHKRKFLKNVEIFVFSKVKSLSRNDIESVCKHLPQLKSINFSKVIELFGNTKDYDVLSGVCNHCPNLEEIIFHDFASANKPTISCKLFDKLLQDRGVKLISLDFSNLFIKYMKELLSIIASSCPNLEQLIVQDLDLNSSNRFFPIEIMQNGLQKLKVLRLGYPILLLGKSSKEYPGFPNLETFTCPSNEDIYNQDNTFKKLLVKSPDLKILDVRGCVNITSNALCSLPAPNLERLYVSHTGLYNSSNFIGVLKKWGHSLVVLDVSRMKGNAINEYFISLISGCSLQNLESLDVNNTAITTPTLRLLIENCPKLKFLNVGSCRRLARGCKHVHIGKKAINELFLKLEIDMEVN